MSNEHFFYNRDYIEYVRLLFEFHKAITEGWDQTEAGEAIRERLDSRGIVFRAMKSRASVQSLLISTH